MANRDDWESGRNRGWERDRDWEMEDRSDIDYSRRTGTPMTGERRGRWGTSGRYGRGGSFGRGPGGERWEREEGGFGDFGGERAMEERRGRMSDRDWDRYGEQRYGGRELAGQEPGGWGESYRSRYGREEGMGGYGGEISRVGYGRMSYGREGSGVTGLTYRRGYAAEWRRGPHAGRGPKGWKRSDERIQEDVNEALARDPDLDASSIEVKVRNAEVTLTGVVEDRADKRLAEDLAEEVFGVEDVHNELKVRHGAFARITGEKADEEDERQAREGATTNRAQSSGRSTTRSRS